MRRWSRMVEENTKDPGLWTCWATELRRKLLQILDRHHGEMTSRTRHLVEMYDKFVFFLIYNQYTDHRFRHRPIEGGGSVVYESRTKLPKSNGRDGGQMECARPPSVDSVQKTRDTVMLLRVFLNMCISVASCERSFFKLDLVKTYTSFNYETGTSTSLNVCDFLENWITLKKSNRCIYPRSKITFHPRVVKFNGAEG